MTKSTAEEKGLKVLLRIVPDYSVLTRIQTKRNCNSDKWREFLLEVSANPMKRDREIGDDKKCRLVADGGTDADAGAKKCVGVGDGDARRKKPRMEVKEGGGCT